MEKELKIGIFELTLPWQTILNQIGAPYTIVSKDIDISSHIFSIIIINRPVSSKELEGIKGYINNGGAIIDEGYCIDKLSDGKIEKKKINYIVPNNLPFKQVSNIIDLYSEVLAFSKAQYLGKTLFIDNYGEGIVSFLGLRIDTLLFDTRSKRKEFYGTLPRFPNEEVSSVSKGEITRLIFFLIRYLHISRNLPFVHKWFFPGQAENVFIFRIDSDFGNKNQIKQWYDIGKSCDIKYTWFLHVSAHTGWLNAFSEFKDHEIAIHAYDHFASDNYSIYKQDIQKASNLLKKNGFPCSGYASPYGVWNKAVNTACEDLGFSYSSEFSYVYDSLPINPAVNNKKSTVLQIPIHPICIGSLLNAKADEKGMVEYFTNEFRRQMAMHNPLIFYDHVTHGHPDVLREMFKYIQTLNIPSLTFAEFSKWWSKREHIAFSASMDSTNQIKINASKLDKDCFFAVWINDDSYILTNDTVIDLDSHPKKKADYHINFDIDSIKKTRKSNLRVTKQSLFNKYFWRNYR